MGGEHRQHLQELVRTWRSNLNYYEAQASRYDPSSVPLELANNIHSAKLKIKELEEELLALSEDVPEPHVERKPQTRYDMPTPQDQRIDRLLDKVNDLRTRMTVLEREVAHLAAEVQRHCAAVESEWPRRYIVSFGLTLLVILGMLIFISLEVAR